VLEIEFMKRGHHLYYLIREIVMLEWQLCICSHEVMLQSSDDHVAGLFGHQSKNSASHITHMKKEKTTVTEHCCDLQLDEKKEKT